jgi:hypothetical protein
MAWLKSSMSVRIFVIASGIEKAMAITPVRPFARLRALAFG